MIPIFTLYTSIVNSHLFILLSTLGTIYEAIYDFSPSKSGLAYLGMMVGFLISELMLGLFWDVYATRRAHRRAERVMKPEDRVTPLIFGLLLLPISLLLYGWMMEHRTLWLAPVVGSVHICHRCIYPAYGKCYWRDVDCSECYLSCCAFRSGPTLQKPGIWVVIYIFSGFSRAIYR